MLFVSNLFEKVTFFFFKLIEAPGPALHHRSDHINLIRQIFKAEHFKVVLLK